MTTLATQTRDRCGDVGRRRAGHVPVPGMRQPRPSQGPCRAGSPAWLLRAGNPRRPRGRHPAPVRHTAMTAFRRRAQLAGQLVQDRPVTAAISQAAAIRDDALAAMSRLGAQLSAALDQLAALGGQLAAAGDLEAAEAQAETVRAQAAAQAEQARAETASQDGRPARRRGRCRRGPRRRRRGHHRGRSRSRRAPGCRAAGPRRRGCPARRTPGSRSPDRRSRTGHHSRPRRA